MKPSWLIWGFLPGTASIMWYLAGRETRTPQYYLYAACYAIIYLISFVLFFLAGILGTGLLAFMGIVFIFLTWIGSYRHTVRDRYEIWLRIKFNAAASHKKKPILTLEDRIELEYGLMPKNLIPPPCPPPNGANAKEQSIISEIAALMNQQSFPAVNQVPPADVVEQNQKIDPNTADRETLAALPCIGTTLALEIILNREQHGLFYSFDDFCTRCAVKPHHRIVLEENIKIRPASLPPEQLKKSKQKTRQVD